MGHSEGVCSRVQEAYTPRFRCDRERSIACLSEWIEAVGQTRGQTKSLDILSSRKGVYVKRITRKMLLMARATTTIMVMGNYKNV
ncbi:hypothetical protein Goari_027252 [Gossypium aridum]|uniref:Uncharacterized protein n=1 Tax=Gossypium aridum TaxID=34290 RepID=A0A7J8YPM8_GOSAI|nr:hypothetical protein [Gossypium aridum]